MEEGRGESTAEGMRRWKKREEEREDSADQTGAGGFMNIGC